MRIVFLGSGAFAAPAFEALLDAGHEIATLVTQPDREKGRGKGLAPPPMRPVAERRAVPVLQLPRVRDLEAQQTLRLLRPELQVIVAFGQILPRSVIEIAPFGTVNLHASLLPRFRGAAPIQWAIASGATETGVTTMLVDEGLDTGPTLLSAALPIAPEETAAELEPRLARLGAEVLLATVRGLAAGGLLPQPQDHGCASYAPLLKKEDGRIDWRRPAREIAWRLRGFTPWPGAFTFLAGRQLKLLRAVPLDTLSEPAEPGRLVRVGPEAVVVACGEGSALRLGDVQPESRKAMSAWAWAAGARLAAGAHLG